MLSHFAAVKPCISLPQTDFRSLEKYFAPVFIIHNQFQKSTSISIIVPALQAVGDFAAELFVPFGFFVTTPPTCSSSPIEGDAIGDGFILTGSPATVMVVDAIGDSQPIMQTVLVDGMVVDYDSLLFDPSMAGEDEKSPEGGGDQRRRSVEWVLFPSFQSIFYGVQCHRFTSSCSLLNRMYFSSSFFWPINFT
ncbi:hypothetical protein L1887_30411 [Cichorium endivia]|nr:hypothetical protein L1887_30411 [Cichorium endivia]